ncbi:hypothetical protein EPUS_04835 [Endocarpon pusillum Z07020]|uniref:Uncharacterized protein n=1 Tax=Endocarpon pusillum (strain Z07020 / HMAS-L-300199) TaxID=1263415 RepID=U1GRP1_ENDPU|nr:uncharacterized protein EPUS_04835 [Endocarpon pusillum Z07020]ERF75053.1 hypothetical protein EPUS_04835 [Endocarpon pusillum Z07020]
MSLPPEVRANYIGIIDSILAQSDLSRISEKKVRQGIQAKVEYDITPQKAAIKGLILERFDIFNARQQELESKTEQAATPAPATNGYHAPSPERPTPVKSPAKREATSETVSDVIDESLPKKKRKELSVDADAALAARLQAEEDKRARPTRGGSSKKAAPVKKKTPKKKTAVRVRGSDESDLDDSLTEKKPKNTGFNKPMNLSAALSELLQGETALSRPQCVKRIWQHIREHDLQDPSDKRNIICDEAMRKVFKQDKIHMFTMNKVLNQNLYPIDD